MTNETISAKLDAILDPLNSITEQANAALVLALRCKLPTPFIRTIRDSINRLDAAHDQLLDIATTLDPNLCKHERQDGLGSGKQNPLPLANPKEPANDNA